MSSSPTPDPHRNVGNDGERITPEEAGPSFYAHLSIYRFALPFTSGKRVLDAGCGTGYGSVYLSQSAARVTACDGSADAISYCRDHYADHAVNFSTVNLCGRLPYEDGAFEVVFSSNVMEHLAEVDGFLAECCRVMTQDGVMIVAVPPVHSPQALTENLKNVFHVMNLTPAGWQAKLERFFEKVECYAHFSGGRFADPAIRNAEWKLPPEEVTMRETDFVFPPTRATDFAPTLETWTALYVAREPRSEALPQTLAEQIPAAWHYGSLVADVIKAERAEAEACRKEIAHLTQHHQERNAQHHDRVKRLKERGDRWKAQAQKAEGELKTSKKGRLVRWLTKLGLGG